MSCIGLSSGDMDRIIPTLNLCAPIQIGGYKQVTQGNGSKWGQRVCV